MESMVIVDEIHSFSHWDLVLDETEEALPMVFTEPEEDHLFNEGEKPLTGADLAMEMFNTYAGYGDPSHPSVKCYDQLFRQNPRIRDHWYEILQETGSWPIYQTAQSQLERWVWARIRVLCKRIERDLNTEAGQTIENWGAF